MAGTACGSSAFVCRDGLAGAELAEVGGADVEHHRDRRRRDRGQCGDVAGMPRRHLQHQVVGGRRWPAAPSTGCPSSLLNEPGGATTSPSGAQHRGDQILGRRLARRAGDADDRQPARRPVRRPPRAASRASAASTAAPEPSVSCSSTPGRAASASRRRRSTTIAGTPTGRAASTADRTRGHRRRGEVVAVGARTGQRQEQTAGRHRPRVELDGAGDADAERPPRR